MFRFLNSRCFNLIIFLSSGCKSTQLSKVEGQGANLLFPYPCDSTRVTLQQSTRLPFYRSTDGSTLSLPLDQVNRFEVQNIKENRSCSLNLTIRDLMKNDQGTYILFVYKDGEILGDDTHRIGLLVDYPPDKASCVVGEDKGGNWISVDCTANAGSLQGKIECFQNGEWMPPLTRPTKTGLLLKQTILIRKSQPVFCCSSIWNEDKPKCECNDTGLNLPADIHHPCHVTSDITTISLPSPVTKIDQRDHYSTVDHLTPNKRAGNNYKKEVIILSFFLSVTMVTVILLAFSFFVLYKTKFKEKKKENSQVPPQDAKSMNGKLVNGHTKKNGSITKNGQIQI